MATIVFERHGDLYEHFGTERTFEEVEAATGKRPDKPPGGHATVGIPYWAIHEAVANLQGRGNEVILKENASE